VVEADEKPSGMRTQGGADDGPGEPTDDRAQEKRPDARARRTLHTGYSRFGRRIG
jgi:hypothetical protein